MNDIRHNFILVDWNAIAKALRLKLRPALF